MTMTSGGSTGSEDRVVKLKRLRALASYCPLRLDERERSLLAVLEATLHVSEYTDNIDTSSRRNKARGILDGLLESCAISTGLAVVANQNDYGFTDPSSLGSGDGKSSILAKITAPIRKGSKLKKQSNFSSSGQNASSLSNYSDDGTSIATSAASVVSAGSSGYDEQQGTLTSKNYESSELLNFQRKFSANIACRRPEENAEFFQEIFEIGRRNKVLNPAKMRTTYGKLMYMLQDSQSSNVARGLGFSLYKEMVMVGSYLADRLNMEELLHDDRLIDATMHISDIDESSGRKIGRDHVQILVQKKNTTAETLISEYGKKASVERNGDIESCKGEVLRCINSLADAVAVIETNVAPVRRMMRLLKENFDPSHAENSFSLTLSGSSYSSIRSGFSYYGGNRFGFGGGGDSSGPTLSHSHPTQYMFVWQSLKLWSKVQEKMHKLWVCADSDLLSTSHGYQLWNTGQGLNRVQSCPQVSKVMHGLLGETKRETGAWVGLSVVHLGDRDVPNALMFIDKYTQIPRFLQPIVSFIDSIPVLMQNQHVADYIKNEFGNERNLKMLVLSDYFKYGFDGSGDDGGSCIDGRLTSSWNWTSRVAKKKYYNILMMSGFQGFDGDFK